MTTDSLFTPCKAGVFDLAHRIVLAPMTRIRATEETLAPNALTTEYYRQRATPGGLLITEATHISPEATPVWTIYPAVRKHGGHVPGIWTDEQTRGWKAVTEAVHARGAKISCQLLHTGRVAQPDIGEHPIVKGSGLPLPPVSSSAVPIMASAEEGNQYNWDQDSVTPRALTTDEIARVCRDYQHATRNALQAGFDYVELHAAHGYLIDQFICDGVNQRSDQYGGSIENRCRFLFEIVAALVEVMGNGRVGVRLSPIVNEPVTGKPKQIYFGVTCSDPEQVFSHAISGLNRFPLAYLMLTEPRVGGLSLAPEEETAYTHPLSNKMYRTLYHGTLIGAGGFTPHTAASAVADGIYDLIAFGRWFLSNPDLPERIRQGYPLNIYDRATFYGGKEEGYTDYPEWNRVEQDAPSKYRLMAQSRIGASLGKKSASWPEIRIIWA